jgi:putative membrane protein
MEPRTGLAFERTFLAYERTQMAWVRTGLGLISFGFAIAKFFDFLHRQAEGRQPYFGAFTVGMIMIGIGLGGMILATAQHERAVRSLRKRCPDLPRSIATAAGMLIILLGVAAFVAALIRH